MAAGAPSLPLRLVQKLDGKNPSNFWVARTVLTLLAAGLLHAALFMATFAQAASAHQPSICQAIAQNRFSPPVILASQAGQSLNLVQTRSYTVKVHYAVHSTYRIESPQGVIIATDFAGQAGSGPLPHIVTMNHAHGTHYTLLPDPAIAHVLKGWGSPENPAKHYLTLADTLTRNVTTDIYSGGSLVEKDGNSIFIFEIAGLCIGHVGHLHHTLTPQHFAEIGRLDVLMVPVDGRVTLTTAGVSELVRQLRASVVLPMHWFSGFSLQRFINEISGSFAVDVRTNSQISLSLNNLPSSPTVIVLQPEITNDFDDF